MQSLFVPELLRAMTSTAVDAQPLIENDRIVSFLVPRASHARLPTSVDCNPPAAVAHMGEQMSNPRAGRNVKLARAMRMLYIVLWSVSCTVVLSWLVTGSWLLNNVLGVAICVTCMAVIELPNVRICCILLGLLFVYDFFWVFLSEWCASRTHHGGQPALRFRGRVTCAWQWDGSWRWFVRMYKA